MEALLIKFWPLLAILLVGIVLYVFYRNGWDQLARHYKLTGIFSDQIIMVVKSPVIKYEPMQLWKGNMRSRFWAKLAADQKGFYLKTTFPMSLVHPALFIPWGDISDSWSNKTFIGVEIKQIRLHFKEVPGVCIQTSEYVVGKMKEQSRGNWKNSTV